MQNALFFSTLQAEVVYDEGFQLRQPFVRAQEKGRTLSGSACGESRIIQQGSIEMEKKENQNYRIVTPQVRHFKDAPFFRLRNDLCHRAVLLTVYCPKIIYCLFTAQNFFTVRLLSCQAGSKRIDAGSEQGTSRNRPPGTLEGRKQTDLNRNM